MQRFRGRNMIMPGIVLLATGCRTAPQGKGTSISSSTESFSHSPEMHIAGVTREASTTAVAEVSTYYRGGRKILERFAPKDRDLNRVFYIYLEDHKIFTYKSGPAGTEFRSADDTRQFFTTGYTVKLAGDRESRIRRIVLYSTDFKTTFDGFWLKNNEVVPWSLDELENWRKMRDSGPIPPDESEVK